MPSIATPLNRALPQVDRASVRLRSCAARALRRGWPSAATGACFSLQSVSPAPIAADALLAVVATSAGQISLAIEPQRWPALAMAASLPDSGTRSAVASLLLGEFLGRLADTSFTVDLRTTAPPASHGSGVALRCGDALLEVLHVDDYLLQAAERHCTALEPTMPATALAWRLPSRLILASRPMPRQVLQGLRCGDVVVLPLHQLPDDSGAGRGLCARAVLAWGGDSPSALRAPVLLRDSTMTLIDAPHEDGASAMLPIERDGADASAGIVRSLARLELPVQFELAGPSLRLADIAGLAADDVLELAMPIEQARVRIRVAEQCIGHGELVALGGRLGVRVLRIEPVDGRGGAA
ncbi:hypothetical protein GT347_19640 [Xylophilus rhododendri]|uniref:Flagellar motor switch protein FliN-like C-terminal domain-containing protein n=1 Tax=Xylophilus rhododendri TaxID=2697032 RepID=A0A857JB82_9BURK|nr:FliM/FliN family flagellar motor switch protein [Xylophilus rhododendri]QHI99998.1 hypothetical protein GT347_19640 [Xylophilus rhododendri]